MMHLKQQLKNLVKKKEVAKASSPREVPKMPAHQHVWKVVGKTYAPPSNLNFSGGQIAIPPEVFEKAMFGVTTLLWECVCGETKKEELLGSDEDLLESLVDKADKIGPQFIERRGKSFIISEWKPQPSMIPLK